MTTQELPTTTKPEPCKEYLLLTAEDIKTNNTITLDPTKPPWFQQEGEGDKAYFYFQVFQKLGPIRNIQKLKRTLKEIHDITLEAGTLYNYSHNYMWSSRVSTFDRSMSQALATVKPEQIREMEYRHTKLARLLQERAIDILEDPGLRELPLNSQTYVILSTAKAAGEGVRMERLSMGEHTDKTKTVDEGLNKLLDVVNKSKAKVEKARKKESLEDPSIIDADFTKKE